MRLSVTVKANAREEKVERLNAGEFLIWVKAPPKEGRANCAVVTLLGKYLDVAKSRITIVSGHASKNKIVEVL